MKKLLLALLVLVVLGVGGALFASPYWTAASMRDAAEAGNGSALAEHVDFPAVRNSIKAKVREKMNLEKKPERGNLFAALGATFAGALADRMVDSMVTPEGLILLMQGFKPGAEKSQDAAPSAIQSSMGYEGLNSFVIDVSRTDIQYGPVSFVLSRDGVLSWKLTEIRLPSGSPE